MIPIQLEIKALAPLAIGRQKPGGSVNEAEDYIPGSVIRGAIAGKILKQSGHESTDLTNNGGDFQILFLGESPAIFHNAYPAIAQISQDELQSVAEPVRILPATAVSAKNNPGFKSSGKNGAFDTLIDSFCAEAYGYPYDPSDPTALAKGEEARVEPYSGFYSQVGQTYRSHSASKRFLTRVGINRRRATAEDAILYSLEVLNESFPRNPKAKQPTWDANCYRSLIFVANQAIAGSLTGFINQNCDRFRIGGSTSRGLGKVEMKATPLEPAPDLACRVDQFNQALKDRWQLWSAFGNPPVDRLTNRIYFTLDLQADAILTDRWQRTTVISPAMLQTFAAMEQYALPQLHTAYSSYAYRSGWNAAWGLMKDVEAIVNKGATYLFSIPETDKDAWIAALATLEEGGVGDRTAEGFGQVQVCNQFHLVVRENAV